MLTDILNKDDNRIKTILKGLKRNEEKYGNRYCPCKIDKTEDNICPCLDYRKTSICKCGLFIKPIDTLDIVYYMHESHKIYKIPLCYFEPDNTEKICPCRDNPCYYKL